MFQHELVANVGDRERALLVTRIQAAIKEQKKKK